jgi:hypothetical protein
MFRRQSTLRRSMTAFLAVVALLFSQLALASYVCGQDAVAAARMAAMEEPCEGMDVEQPNLCFQFAAEPSQSFEQARAAAPTLPAVVSVLVLPVIELPDLRAAPREVPAELRPPPDPVFLSTLRLRV